MIMTKEAITHTNTQRKINPAESESSARKYKSLYCKEILITINK